MEYIISESYTGYNSSDWWQHGAGISTHTCPVVLHYDESLSAEVEDVFVIDDVTGWDTYNITLIEEATPETGIAINLTVLSISLVMGIVALAVVLRKKEQY